MTLIIEERSYAQCALGLLTGQLREFCSVLLFIKLPNYTVVSDDPKVMDDSGVVRKPKIENTFWIYVSKKFKELLRNVSAVQ